MKIVITMNSGRKFTLHEISEKNLNKFNQTPIQYAIKKKLFIGFGKNINFLVNPKFIESIALIED